MNVEMSPPIREQVVAFLDRGIGSDHDAFELADCFAAIANAASLAHRLDSLISALPLFIEGLLGGLNYAVSFMLLHHFHLIRATKQPAMTAASLASLLRSRDRTERLDRMVEFTDNWAVYHRLPQAIADHRLGERFGRRRMGRVAGIVSRNMSGWATNISLFVLNLSVSFFLSLYTASRAYGLARRELAVLGARLLRRFVQHPLDFILPRNSEEGTVNGSPQGGTGLRP